MMQLGCDGVFVGSGIFKSEDPAARARAIVEAVTYYEDPEAIVRAHKMLAGAPMRGDDIATLSTRLQDRGW